MAQDYTPTIPSDISIKTTRVYGDASIIVMQHAMKKADDVRVSYSIMHLPGVQITVTEYDDGIAG